MTYDNGVEMAEHKYITKNTGIKVFFAHPYSSWERGNNENTNGLIRRFYPKRTTDFNKISNDELKALQDKLNNRPRKVLGYHTPKEVFQYELKRNSIKQNDDHNMGLEMGDKSNRDLFSFLMPKYKLRSKIYIYI